MRELRRSPSTKLKITPGTTAPQMSPYGHYPASIHAPQVTRAVRPAGICVASLKEEHKTPLRFRVQRLFACFRFPWLEVQKFHRPKQIDFSEFWRGAQVSNVMS
jgi:hypothetical protein